MEKENQMQKKDVDIAINEIEEKIAELEGTVPEQQIRLMKEELNFMKVRKERFEKKVATLRGLVQEQLKSKDDYKEKTQKPELEKHRVNRSFNDGKELF